MKMTVEEIISALRENKDLLSERFGVVRIGIFGSFARGEQTTSSDVDFIVEIESEKKDIHNFLGLKRFLERLTERKIDIGFEHSLKPAIKENVLKQTVYA